MMAFDPMRHLNDDTLELIALGRLPAPNLTASEEHLLACDTCRVALGEIDQYIAAIRRGLDQDADGRVRVNIRGRES
jgi:anti-sigma factor RsiW